MSLERPSNTRARKSSERVQDLGPHLGRGVALANRQKKALRPAGLLLGEASGLFRPPFVGLFREDRLTSRTQIEGQRRDRRRRRFRFGILRGDGTEELRRRKAADDQKYGEQRKPALRPRPPLRALHGSLPPEVIDVPHLE